jgi:hypothetical protein
MLSLEDCIALSCLTEDEIAAIAEHEHLPMVIAAELGNYLVQTPDGGRYIKKMIRDDITAADARGDLLHALTLKLVLRHYLSTHPECAGKASCLPTQSDDAIRRVLAKMPPRCA